MDTDGAKLGTKAAASRFMVGLCSKILPSGSAEFDDIDASNSCYLCIWEVAAVAWSQTAELSHSLSTLWHLKMLNPRLNGALLTSVAGFL